MELWKDLFEHGRFPRRSAKLLRKVRLRGEAADAGSVRFGPWAVPRSSRCWTSSSPRPPGPTDPDVDAMHRFRIAGKKLRYAVELLAPAFGEALRTQAYPAIQELQERTRQDQRLASAQARLKRWLEQAEGSEEAAYLQDMLNQEQQRLEERRSEFLAWWNGGRQAELRQLLALQPLISANT